MVGSFTICRFPEVVFGFDSLNVLVEKIRSYGRETLFVTGKASFIQSDAWDNLLNHCDKASITWRHFAIANEPTPEMIDDCVSLYKPGPPSVVVSIGGGSVIDAGKAISAMMCQEGNVLGYLEVVGMKQPSGHKIPFIAVPTTAGTGEEATKNALISRTGKNGFKRSLRHDKFVPDFAIIDPELTINCPKTVSAYSGMDAFTQLLESYLSDQSSVFTDALAVDGIRKIRDSLPRVLLDAGDRQSRKGMSYASFLSGITLAHAGLGTVHGFASSVGGLYAIPHGLICARMMGPVNSITVRKLRETGKNPGALQKYSRIGKLFSPNKNSTDNLYIDLLLDTIERWTEEFGIAGLGNFGVTSKDISGIVDKTGNKNNPVGLTKDELAEALEKAMLK